MTDRYPSLEKALRTLYPAFPWDPTRFLTGSNSARGHWRDVSRQREVMDRIAAELHISQVSHLHCHTSLC